MTILCPVLIQYQFLFILQQSNVDCEELSTRLFHLHVAVLHIYSTSAVDHVARKVNACEEYLTTQENYSPLAFNPFLCPVVPPTSFLNMDNSFRNNSQHIS
jgi:hypothetical protein